MMMAMLASKRWRQEVPLGTTLAPLESGCGRAVSVGAPRTSRTSGKAASGRWWMRELSDRQRHSCCQARPQRATAKSANHHCEAAWKRY